MTFAENVERIRNYIFALQAEYRDPEVMPFKIKAIWKSLEAIARDPKFYDRLTTLNRDWRFNEIINIISAREFDEQSVGDLFEILSRIAREVTLKESKIPTDPEKALLDYYGFDRAELSDREKINREFLHSKMPIYIAMEQWNNVAVESRAIEEKIKTWREELTAIEGKVKEHETNLKKHHTNYNFVGLSAAFQKLLEEKKTQGRWAFCATFLIGVLIILPLAIPLFESGRTLLASLVSDANLAAAIAQGISILGLEIVLIYFFRVSLHYWHSLRAQALQLELRRALCAFIEGYVKFARDNEKMANSLSKFEALIFSGLVSEPGQLPGTYDGFDAISKVVRDIKGG